MLPSFINPLITLAIYRQHVSAAPRGPLHLFQEEGLNLSCFLAILFWRNPMAASCPQPLPCRSRGLPWRIAHQRGWGKWGAAGLWGGGSGGPQVSGVRIISSPMAEAAALKYKPYLCCNCTLNESVLCLATAPCYLQGICLYRQLWLLCSIPGLRAGSELLLSQARRLRNPSCPSQGAACATN